MGLSIYGMQSFVSGKRFKIIELFVVIAVLAILVSILLLSIQNAREKGKSAVCSSNLNQLGIQTPGMSTGPYIHRLSSLLL